MCAGAGENALVSRRLFVALIPPRAVLDQLAEAIAPLRADLPTVRWTRPETWHLTLAFLGAVEPEAIEALVDRLDRVAGRQDPIELAVAGAGRFGDQVLWAGISVSGDRESVRRLADSVRAAARRSGVEVESRPYRGHITLARGTSAIDLRPLVERLRRFIGSPWTAAELYLVESQLGAGPGRTARYETRERWPLRQRDLTDS